MTQPSTPVTIEALLSQSDWVRRLAYSLTRDAAEADDLVQETWLVVAQHPPAHDSNLKSWLRTVMKSIRSKRWRGETRRTAREQSVAESELADDVAELSARASMLSKVAGHVHALDEAQRTVVLLRYFDDLPPRKIAERLGVPVNTVNSRLQRAHARLRELLRDEFGDGWAAALLPLLRWPPGDAVPQTRPDATRARRSFRSTTAVTALLAVGVAVVVAALSGSGPQRTQTGITEASTASSPGPAAAKTARRRTTETGGATDADAAALPANDTSRAAAATEQESDDITVRATGTVTVTGAVEGRVTLRVTPLTSGDRDINGTVRTFDVAAGHVQIRLPRADEKGRRTVEWLVTADAPDHLPQLVHVLAPLPGERRDAAIPDITLLPAPVATGIVKWDGNPGATARVGSFIADRMASMKPFDLVRTASGAEFRLRLPPGKRAVVVAVMEECLPFGREVDATAPGEVRPMGEFALVPGNWIRGRIAADTVGIGTSPRVNLWSVKFAEKCLDFDGCWVSWDGASARRYGAQLRPGPDGSFAAGGFEREPFRIILEGALGRVAGDMVDPVVNRGVESPTDAADLVFSGTPFEIAVTSGGQPVAGARVRLQTSGTRAFGGLTDADGGITLLGRPGSTYALNVELEGYEPSKGEVAVPGSGPAARTAVDLTAIPKEQPATWIVRVRTAGGEVPAIVGFGLFKRQSKGEEFISSPHFVRDVRPTDGEFRIENVPPGQWRLEIRPGAAWHDPGTLVAAPALFRQLGAGETVHDDATATEGGRARLELTGLEGVEAIVWPLRVRNEAQELVRVTASYRNETGMSAAPQVPFQGVADLFPALPPGRYTVEADDEVLRGLNGFRVPFEIVADQVTHVQVKVSRR